MKRIYYEVVLVFKATHTWAHKGGPLVEIDTITKMVTLFVHEVLGLKLLYWSILIQED